MYMKDLRDRLRSDERTDLTDGAFALAAASLRAAAAEHGITPETYGRRVREEYDGQSVAGFEVQMAGGAMWVLAFGYMTEVRGQSSAGGHGKQGSAPERIAALRELPVPARMVFVDQGGRKWQAVWLDIDEPEVVNIDNDTTHRRQGWRVKDMERGEGLIPFPDEPPVPSLQAQAALL